MSPAAGRLKDVHPEAVDQIRKIPRMDAVSLFSGAGGLDLGLSQAADGRLKFRAWVESDPDAQETLRKNHSDTDAHFWGDIRDVQPREILAATGLAVGEPFLLSGGPPCQAFSTAGLRRSVHEERGQVLANYLQMVKTIQPRFFLFENVRGLLSVALKHRTYRERIEAERKRLVPADPDEHLGSVFQQVVLPRFKALGYEVVYGLLNAADYGTAQSRWRVIVMGSRDKEFGAGRFRKETGEQLTPSRLVPPTHHRFASHSGVQPWRTLRDAIGDLANQPPSPDSVFTYSEARTETWKLVPPGANWTYVRDHPDEFPPGFLERMMGGAISSGGGKMGYWRRLAWDRPAPTLQTQPQHLATGFCHPDFPRPLSVREYARLQDFPDEYVFAGTKGSAYAQIGNAVPVRLAAALGRALLTIAWGR